MAAEIGEALLDPHALFAEDVGPDAGQHLLGRRARGDVAVRSIRGARLERGEGAAIDLAVGGERERGEDRERGRDHVVGQAIREEGRERGGRGIGKASGDDEGGEAPGVAVVEGEHHRRLDAGVGAERGLDLAELDPEAADLHLKSIRPRNTSVPSAR